MEQGHRRGRKRWQGGCGLICPSSGSKWFKTKEVSKGAAQRWLACGAVEWHGKLKRGCCSVSLLFSPGLFTSHVISLQNYLPTGLLPAGLQVCSSSTDLTPVRVECLSLSCSLFSVLAEELCFKQQKPYLELSIEKRMQPKLHN